MNWNGNNSKRNHWIVCITRLRCFFSYFSFIFVFFFILFSHRQLFTTRHKTLLCVRQWEYFFFFISVKHNDLLRREKNETVGSTLTLLLIFLVGSFFIFSSCFFVLNRFNKKKKKRRKESFRFGFCASFAMIAAVMTIDSFCPWPLCSF